MSIFMLSACGNKEAPGDENDETKVIKADVIEKETENNNVSPTTGMDLEESEGEKIGFAVMVENSPASRPHSGLADADLVYEIEVEGGITRFLAVFHDSIPEQIGPVRSSRHYFIPIAESWNIPYIHLGGSPQAYEKLKQTSIKTIDGISSEWKYFERDNSRKAPHNAYLLTNKLLPGLDTDTDKEANMEPNPHYTFGENDELNETGNDVKNIYISYPFKNEVSYKYDKEDESFKRYINSEPHKDRVTGAHISPRHVIVLYAHHESIPGDKSGRIHVDLNNEGRAGIFTYGKYLEGTWKNVDGKLEVFLNGEKLRLKPGKTWIQIVDENRNDQIHFE